LGTDISIRKGLEEGGDLSRPKFGGKQTRKNFHRGIDLKMAILSRIWKAKRNTEGRGGTTEVEGTKKKISGSPSSTDYWEKKER